MSRQVPAALTRLVRERAKHHCEYCGMPQQYQEGTFHIDHVLPRIDGGPTTASNLALACITCSLKKGSRTHARDPLTRRFVAFFDPRRNRWGEHFAWSESWQIVGKTAIGRATVEALGMNRADLLRLREVLAQLGQILHPETD